MTRYNQMGGETRHWSFDPEQAESIPEILKHLIIPSAEDQYFEEESPFTILANILDHLLADLPEELGDPVRLIYLTGLSYRGAGEVLGIDHKTVKKRANQGLLVLKSRLMDTAWVASLLQGQLPETPTVARLDSNERVLDILNSLNKKGNSDDTEED
jgi:DNA-directed RNA polymerase specialized sigma24 family protein